MIGGGERKGEVRVEEGTKGGEGKGDIALICRHLHHHENITIILITIFMSIVTMRTLSLSLSLSPNMLPILFTF